MRFILIIALIAILPACTTVHKKEPQPAASSIKTELSKIEIDINTGSTKRAVQRLQKITTDHANTDAADDAHILLGNIYFKEGSFNDSYKSYISVINSEFFSPREVDASLGAANALHKLGRYDEALSLTANCLKKSALSPATLIEVHTLRYNIQAQLGDRLDALRSLVFLSENSPDKNKQERYKIKALEYVDSSLREEELKTVADNSNFSFVRSPALYRVATTYFEQRDYTRAEDYFRKIIDSSPDTDLAHNAKNFIEQIEARRRVSPFTIGVVLPISGKHAAIAQKTLRGLQMGLGITDNSPSDFKLAIIDSESNPDIARRAVERLVIEDSAIAIVGDLLSKTSEPVAQKADELGVPIIGLSQKAGLTKIGDNVFRNALTSAALVRELVKNSIEKYGMKRFAILYPNDPYGIEYANLFWDEVLSHGGQITAAQSYAAGEKDFRGAISRLVGTYYLEDRIDEYTNLVRTWFGEQKVITSRVTVPADILPPVIDFDAIFIPDGVKNLAQIASMLIYNDISGIRLLGTNIWNSSTLVSRGTTLIENSLFVDARSAVDDSLSTTPFFKSYLHTYKESPSVFESQAYDTGLALRRTIEGGARSRIALKEALSRIRNFVGTVGEISVTDDREFTRPLSLLTVKDGKIQVAEEPSSNIKN